MVRTLKKIVVTGGAGFIGSHLVDNLILKGYNVKVIDNLSQGLLENIKKHITNDKFEFIKEDIQNKEKINKALNGADVVIHLAAVVSVIRSIKEPELVNSVNVTGTLNVLNACVKQNVKRFIFASSAAVYGGNVNLPVKVECAVNPLSPYAASKAAGEAYCKAYFDSFGLETIILRFMNIYGTRRSTGLYSGVMIKFAEAITKKEPLTIFGDGYQSRDFTYVNDVVNAIILAINKEDAKGETFNIGTGTPTTINELANKFIKITKNSNQKIMYTDPRKGEIRHSYADISKTKKILGYEPKTNQEEALRDFIDWYKNKERINKKYNIKTLNDIL